MLALLFSMYAFTNYHARWNGERGTVNEYGVNAATGDVLVSISERYFRPTEACCAVVMVTNRWRRC